jgi:amino acid adenylation domain-containing protein
VLVGIWSEVLGLDRVGVQDNFFELGGHSLLATQVISRLRDAFSVELYLYSLFEAPTITSLGERVEAARRKGLGLQAPPILHRTRNESLPLSFAQQRLWFVDQLVPEAAMYNIPLAYRVTGKLNVGVLEQSLAEVVLRHESLRTTIETIDGQPIQAIAPEIILTLPVVDLREIAEAQRDAEVQWLSTQEAQQSFDLTKAPLLRAKLLRLDEAEHVLLLTIHHIVSDGWSLGVLMRELAVLYEAFSSGKPASLPELPIQYADFAIWQREWLSGEVLESNLAYWKHQLGGELLILELPTDRPRPLVQTYRGARQSFELSKDLTDALKVLSRREEVTLFMTLLAAFKVLLYRYTGQEDVIVGSPIANRNRTVIEGLIGFFVNTLVLRSDLGGTPSFRDLLGRVREVALGAYTHQDLPFERLVEELQPDRDMSYNPLFQVMFVLQNAPMSDWGFSRLTLSPLEVESKTAKFDLALSLTETEQGLIGAFEYNTDLFDEASIARTVGHWQTLLDGVVADPDERICELPILTEAERYQLLVEWNDTAADYPKDKCIHQLFEEQVEQTPGNVAVVLEDKKLTYRELNARANQLAHYLQKLGVGPEVLVGICVERSPEMVIGLMGILKAGGAYVPLDPNHPQERLVFMMSDSKIPILLTQRKLLARLPESGAYVVCLEPDRGAISEESEKNPLSSVTKDNLAYVIYTAGSTGKPKGVMIQHQSLLNFAEASIVEYGLNKQDRVLQFASISFDSAAEEIFPCLRCGGTLVLRTDEMLSSVPRFLQKCQDLMLTVLNLPTAYWHQVTAELATTDLVLIPESLRLVIIRGERALPKLWELWKNYVGTHPQLVSGYGLTEGTVLATSCKLWGSVSETPALSKVPIGRPISNVQLYILDQFLQPVPIGVPGEIYIGGVGLARGYLNRPKLTEEKFIPNPFSDELGARLYITGDLARYLLDGNIEFLGRIDNQVKIRGLRVELGEIEAVLSQHSSVRETAILVQDNTPCKKRLVAYVVLNPEQSISTDELRLFLKYKLPDYMIPSTILVLNSLPLTPNGRVDLRALPTPVEGTQEHSVTFMAPRTPVEQQVANIWTQVLQMEKVGIYDNFFELGGNSLHAIQVIYRLHQAFQVELPLSSLFEEPTVSGLAEHIETVYWTVQDLQPPSMDPLGNDREEIEL